MRQDMAQGIEVEPHSYPATFYPYPVVFPSLTHLKSYPTRPLSPDLSPANFLSFAKILA